jgi:hypothetical protein
MHKRIKMILWLEPTNVTRLSRKYKIILIRIYI